MKAPREWTRREFTAASVLATLAGVTITISGCGDSSSPADPTPTPTPTPPPTSSPDVNGVVGSNHGHSATVSAAELTSSATITIDIQGDSDHPHTVDLTPADLGQIAAGTRVVKTSSMDQFHTHTVTFN